MSQQINTDIQMRVGAEDLACLGYQPDPKLVLGELGGFSIVNESGQNKRTVLFNDTIRTAWTQLLAELTSRFPDLQIPDILQSPRFFPVTADKQHGIFLRPDGIEFTGGWVKTGTEAAEGEIAIGGYILYTLDCEPIFIPFEQPLDSHLTLHDASDYDVWLPLAEDGTEMYEYLPDYEGCKVYHWNRTWVKAVGHQPCPLETFLHGWTERLNAAFFRNLEARITALESKLKNA